MLETVIADGGQSSVAALARTIGMPVATAHRQVATLVAQGYLMTSTGGRYLAGPRLLGLFNIIDPQQLLAATATPVLDALSARLGTIAQLGTFENDMVTYRVKTGSGAADLFTKVGMQLEAYCSAIGKVLLAYVSPTQRQGYLSAGPFPALTPRTITDPVKLATELASVQQQGFALDDEEVSQGLVCVAVPVRTGGGEAIAAISVSFAGPLRETEFRAALAALRIASGEIEAAISIGRHPDRTTPLNNAPGFELLATGKSRADRRP